MTPDFSRASAGEIHRVLAAAHARLAELETPQEPEDEELTREQAAALVGEPSVDRFYRRGFWERARVKTYQKKPLYSRKILLAIQAQKGRMVSR